MKNTFIILILGLLFVHPITANPKKTITFIIAEREYKTEKSVPAFAHKNLSQEFILYFSQAPKEGTNRNILKNSSKIEYSDLLFISVRRRAFKERTMNLIRNHVSLGKPIIAIRTTSHAFDLKNSPVPKGHQVWTEWDKKVIGGNYNGHYGKGKICSIEHFSKPVPHPILQDVKLPFTTPATLYKNSPLPKSSTVLLQGRIKDSPSEPVAWTNRTASKAKIFYTSLGHIEDFEKPAFKQLLINAVKWGLKSN
jgi:hypothetical protein